MPFDRRDEKLGGAIELVQGYKRLHLPLGLYP